MAIFNCYVSSPEGNSHKNIVFVDGEVPLWLMLGGTVLPWIFRQKKKGLRTMVCPPQESISEVLSWTTLDKGYKGWSIIVRGGAQHTKAMGKMVI